MMGRKYNIVMLGDGEVGKTALVRQFLYGRWRQQYQPTVEQYYRHLMRFSPKICRAIEILDTAGNYQFPAMRELAIRSGHAFLIVFSIDNEDSLKTAVRLRNEIAEIKGEKEVPVVLVGNKADVTNRKVSVLAARKCARLNFDHNYIETSAKYNINVEELFTDLCKEQLKIEIPAKAGKGGKKERNKTLVQRILGRNSVRKNNEDEQEMSPEIHRRRSSESDVKPLAATKSDGLFRRLSRRVGTSFRIVRRRNIRQNEPKIIKDDSGASELSENHEDGNKATINDAEAKHKLEVPTANIIRSRSVPKSTKYFNGSRCSNSPKRCYNLPKIQFTQQWYTEMWARAEEQFANTERKR